MCLSHVSPAPSSDSCGMKVLCGCALLLLEMESWGGETLGKEVCQAGSSGDVW